MSHENPLSFLKELTAREIEQKEEALLNRVLQASADHGMYGMNLLRTLYQQIPETRCDNCGSCCNSVSIYSLEYHLIVRDMLAGMPPRRIRQIMHEVLHLERRLTKVSGEYRLRCAFRSSESRSCLIHQSRPFCCRLFGQNIEGAPPECDRVFPLLPGSSLQRSQVEDLQIKVMSNSESFKPYPDLGAISFFPFEFWVFRYALGPEKALQLYRSVLVPASTPLTRFWQKERRRQAEGASSLPDTDTAPPRRPSSGVSLLTDDEIEHLRKH